MIARTTLGRSLAVTLSLALSQVLSPVAQAATPHLVTGPEVTARLAQSAALHEQQVRLVQEALDTDASRTQAQSMGLSLPQLRAAVPHLSDAELKDLSDRAARVKDVTAGHRGGGDEGLIILAVVLLLAAVVILVATNYDNGYYDPCYCY